MTEELEKDVKTWEDRYHHNNGAAGVSFRVNLINNLIAECRGLEDNERFTVKAVSQELYELLVPLIKEKFNKPLTLLKIALERADEGLLEIEKHLTYQYSRSKMSTKDMSAIAKRTRADIKKIRGK